MTRKILLGIALIVSLPLIIGYCGFYGLVAGPGDYNRNYHANDLICSIDVSIQEEVDRKLPNGFLGQPYSPSLWNDYWNARVQGLVDADIHKDAPGYVGPTGRRLMLYALLVRRDLHLPDLTASTETQVDVASLYQELSQSSRKACDYLEQPSPSCLLSTQYPDPEARRLTRRCS
jgi:hypothetical protein